MKPFNLLPILLFILLTSCQKSKQDPLSCASGFCSSKGLEEIKSLKNTISQKRIYYFKINFIWATSDAKPLNVFFQKKIEKLNQSFDGSDIYFTLGQITQKTPFQFNIDQLYECDKIAKEIQKELKTEINVVIVNKGKTINGYTKVFTEGFSRYKKSHFNTIFLHAVSIKNTSTLQHELGHFFGLQHTFGKKKNADAQKHVEKDCSNEGDFICDTPFDPNFEVDSNCQYVNFKNEKITASTNYMSYSPNHCKNNFSKEQKDLMHLFSSNFRSYLSYKIEQK